MFNMLFNNVTDENEKCLLFLFKTEQIFWPTKYIAFYENHRADISFNWKNV